MRSYVGVGLLVLLFVFPVSFFGGFGVTFFGGPSFGALKAYPNLHLEYIRNAFLFQILPSAAALAVNIIAFVKEKRHSTGIFDKFWFPLVVSGDFFYFLGASGLWWAYNDYFVATDYMEYYMQVHHGVDIRAPLQTVYTMVKIAHVFWLLAGILYMLSPILKVMLKKVSPQQNSSASSAEKALQHAT